MSRYETVSIDRRQDYYERVGGLIAADPLDYYTRAERGRRWQYEAFQHGADYERDAIGTAQSAFYEYDNPQGSM